MNVQLSDLKQFKKYVKKHNPNHLTALEIDVLHTYITEVADVYNEQMGTFEICPSDINSWESIRVDEETRYRIETGREEGVYLHIRANRYVTYPF